MLSRLHRLWPLGSGGKALQSLKYFAEDFPYAFVVVTGSNISLLKSFPVGNVEMMDLLALTIEEFMKDSANPKASSNATSKTHLWRRTNCVLQSPAAVTPDSITVPRRCRLRRSIAAARHHNPPPTSYSTSRIGILRSFHARG